MMQLSDILSVESEDTFTRPTYAANAIATVQTSDAKQVITVRGPAYDTASLEAGSAALEPFPAPGHSGLSSYAGPEPVKRARPENNPANRGVHSGRGLKKNET